MRPKTTSKTAALVAAFRTVAQFLPSSPPIVEHADRYGASLAGWPYTWLHYALQHPAGRALLMGRASPLRALAHRIALRTREFDDALLAAVKSNGVRQVIILGAGLDARPMRLAPVLPGVRFFEVDHPATQKHKVEGLLALITTREELVALNQVNYVAVDFEQPDGAATMSALLVDRGFNPRVPTCVIWEGASTIACGVRNG